MLTLSSSAAAAIHPQALVVHVQKYTIQIKFAQRRIAPQMHALDSAGSYERYITSQNKMNTLPTARTIITLSFSSRS